MIEFVSHWWRGYWFAPDDGRNLALARAIGVAAVLWFALPPLDWTVAMLRANDAFDTPRPAVALLLLLTGEGLGRSAGLWTAVHVVTIAAGVATVLGLATRWSASAVAIGFLLLASQLWSYGELHHPRIIPAWFLIILPFTRCGDRWSLDAWLGRAKPLPANSGAYTWGLRLLLALAAYAYAYSGVWKLVYQGGLEWMNGHTMRYYLSGSQQWPITLWFAERLWLCRVLSVVTIVVEIGFVFAVLVPRSAKYFLLLVFGFHLGNVVTRGENPLFLLWPVLCAFAVLPRRTGAQPEASELQRTDWQASLGTVAERS